MANSAYPRACCRSSVRDDTRPILYAPHDSAKLFAVDSTLGDPLTATLRSNPRTRRHAPGSRTGLPRATLVEKNEPIIFGDVVPERFDFQFKHGRLSAP